MVYIPIILQYILKYDFSKILTRLNNKLGETFQELPANRNICLLCTQVYMLIACLFSTNWPRCSKFLPPPQLSKIPKTKAGLVVVMPLLISGRLYLLLWILSWVLEILWLALFIHFFHQHIFTEGLLYAKCCFWLGGYKINKAQFLPSRPLQSKGDRTKKMITIQECSGRWELLFVSAAF